MLIAPGLDPLPKFLFDIDPESVYYQYPIQVVNFMATYSRLLTSEFVFHWLEILIKTPYCYMLRSGYLELNIW